MKSRKLIYSILLLFTSVLQGFTQQAIDNDISLIKGSKFKFDISPDQNIKKRSFRSNRKIVSNDIWQFTLIENGYFTLGTNQGNSSLAIDDFVR